MKTLIITEKPSVAQRIAQSLGSAKRHSKNGITYFEVGDTFVAPAVGHIFGLMEKNKGKWTYPVFDIEWVPSHEMNKASAFTKKYLANIKFLGKKCKKFINACDYDIEGEVIGFNTIKYACNADPLKPSVKRMKYSTLTKESIISAYNALEPTNKGMAYSGLTRHKLDWYWGINLSRALTIAVKRQRYATLSIGRVQGPTLKLLSIRERQILKFNPEMYWQIEMIASREMAKAPGDKTAVKKMAGDKTAGDKTARERVSSFHIKDKFKDKKEALAAKDNCGDTAVVISAQKRKYEQKPPTPFDLTTLQTEAYKHLKIDPRRTLEIAQELYTSACISYPRTSSQKLPKEIDYKVIIDKLKRIREYKKSCETLLARKKLKPNNGKKKDPAHPAIHPTGEMPRELGGQVKGVYDLICMRFFATFGDPAVRETMTIKLDNNSEIFIAKGTRTAEPGWHPLYGKYAKFDEDELPDLKKGDKLDVDKITMHEKETKPPKRYTPASIIREMEKRNIGTKATRSNIVDILFRRNYLTGKSIEVSPLGLSVVDTMEKYCPDVLSEKLTRKFEKEMEQIESGKISDEKVIEEGKDTIIKISGEFKKKEIEIGKSLAKSMLGSGKASIAGGNAPTLGKCLKCEGNLVIRTSKLGKFVGCNNYPECTYKITLPKGNVKVSGKCKLCGYSILSAFINKKPFRFCINPECPTKKKFGSG